MTDTTTGRASEGSHWYAQDGSCVYQIRAKAGHMRDVDLRDARKLGLVPGFSGIARMEYKPQLERWKIDQAYLAALTLPSVPGETLEQFKERAYQDAQAQAEKARNRGTHLHAVLQGHFEGQPIAAEDAPYVVPVLDWLDTRFPNARWLPEQSFAHPVGYGGKCDLRSAQAVLDYKFKDFSADTLDKVRGYDEHEMQLHAYEHGFDMHDAIKINLFISSTVPGLIVPVEWKSNPASLEAFLCLLRLWQIRKHYDSSFGRSGPVL